MVRQKQKGNKQLRTEGGKPYPSTESLKKESVTTWSTRNTKKRKKQKKLKYMI